MMAVMVVIIAPSCQAATLMRARDLMDPTHAGAMTTVPVIESAQPGAGATANPTVAPTTSCPICAPSTNLQTSADLTAATTRLSATETEPALSGAGAKASLTAEIIIYFIRY